MYPRIGRWPSITAGAAIALSLIACASPAGTPVASTGPVVSASPAATSGPSPSHVSVAPPSASPTKSDPVRFASTVYPYALTLPSTMLTRRWAAAKQPWDGVHRFKMLGPMLDAVGVTDGGLFLIGGAAPSGLDEFIERTVAGTNMDMACTKPTGTRNVTIGGIAGVAFSQDCSGPILVRVTMVRGKQGLVALILASAASEARALDDLIALLDGLEWTSP